MAFRGLVAALLLLLPGVFAANIDVAMTTAVLEGGQVRISSEYQTQSERVEDIYIQLPRDVTKVASTIDGAQRSCFIIKSIVFFWKIREWERVFVI